MKKVLLFNLTLLIVAFVIGCNESKSDSNVSDKNMNDSIQNTFFGASFGDTKEEVSSCFEKHGLISTPFISNDNVLQFVSAESGFFSFGNMSWQLMNVGLKNNQFYQISFYTPVKEKQSAVSNYDDILSALSKKYIMSEEEPEDTTTYSKSVGFGKNNCRVIVSCGRYESLGHEMWYAAFLSYIDDRIADEQSDEL